MWLSAFNVELQIDGKANNLVNKIPHLEILSVDAKNE